MPTNYLQLRQGMQEDEDQLAAFGTEIDEEVDEEEISETLQEVEGGLGDEDKDPLQVKGLRGIRGGAYYSKYRNKGCRNWHGEKGSRRNDFDLYNHVDKSYCKRQFDKLKHQCYGYEYSKNGKCEVWRVPIYYVEYVNGLDCYVKH